MAITTKGHLKDNLRAAILKNHALKELPGYNPAKDTRPHMLDDNEAKSKYRNRLEYSLRHATERQDGGLRGYLQAQLDAIEKGPEAVAAVLKSWAVEEVDGGSGQVPGHPAN